MSLLPEGGPRRLARLCLASALLLAPWPGLQGFCGSLVRGTGNLLVEGRTFGAGGRAWLTPSQEAGSADSYLWIQNTKTGAGRRLALSSRTIAQVPNAVFLSLTMAWGRWRPRRRLAGLAVGLLAVEIYVAAGAMLPALSNLLDPNLGVYHAPRIVRVAADLADRVLVNPPGFEYLIPALIWVMTFLMVGEPAAVEVPAGPSSSGRRARRHGTDRPVIRRLDARPAKRSRTAGGERHRP